MLKRLSERIEEQQGYVDTLDRLVELMSEFQTFNLDNLKRALIEHEEELEHLLNLQLEIEINQTQDDASYRNQ